MSHGRALLPAPYGKTCPLVWLVTAAPLLRVKQTKRNVTVAQCPQATLSTRFQQKERPELKGAFLGAYARAPLKGTALLLL